MLETLSKTHRVTTKDSRTTLKVSEMRQEIIFEPLNPSHSAVSL